MKKILQLQWLYMALGLAFNLASQWRISQGLDGLTSTPPIVGAITMLIVGAVVVVGWSGFTKTYTGLATGLILLLGYGGLWKHLAAFVQPDGLASYSSTLSWLLAVSINAFGVAVLVMGVIAAIQSSRIKPSAAN
jgi:hypothetical protein